MPAASDRRVAVARRAARSSLNYRSRIDRRRHNAARRETGRNLRAARESRVGGRSGIVHQRTARLAVRRYDRGRSGETADACTADRDRRGPRRARCRRRRAHEAPRQPRRPLLQLTLRGPRTARGRRPLPRRSTSADPPHPTADPDARAPHGSARRRIGQRVHDVDRPDFPIRWRAVHSGVKRLKGFTDTAERGPMARWIHRHAYRALTPDRTEVSESDLVSAPPPDGAACSHGCCFRSSLCGCSSATAPGPPVAPSDEAATAPSRPHLVRPSGYYLTDD